MPEIQTAPALPRARGSATGGDVARGLVGKAQEGDAHRLRLYQSAEAPADEQRVVDGTGCRLKFVDHGAQTGALIMSARDRTTRPQSASRVRGV